MIASKEYNEENYRPTLSLSYGYEDRNTENTPIVLPNTSNEKTVKDIMTQNGYMDT
ncbi:MAG: hypothetical protein WCL02_03960 [bacterium]